MTASVAPLNTGVAMGTPYLQLLAQGHDPVVVQARGDLVVLVLAVELGPKRP